MCKVCAYPGREGRKVPFPFRHVSIVPSKMKNFPWKSGWTPISCTCENTWIQLIVIFGNESYLNIDKYSNIYRNREILWNLLRTTFPFKSPRCLKSNGNKWSIKKFRGTVLFHISIYSISLSGNPTWRDCSVVSLIDKVISPGLHN